MTIPAQAMVDLDGEWLAPDEAKISLFNHGFLFGDSVYDVVRTYDGRPSLLAEHLERLERSALAIGLTPPLSREALAERVRAAVERAGYPECYVRIILARGEGPPNIDPSLAGPTRVILLVLPLTLPAEQCYREGVPVIVAGVVRSPLAFIKSGNYLTSVQAIREARTANAFEALMCNARGELTEASTSSVFWVADDALRTPSLEVGILDSITRRHLLRLAREAGWTVEEGVWPASVLAGADEVFLASTIKEVMPVSRVDDHAPRCCPGPRTLELRERYRAFVLGEEGR